MSLHEAITRSSQEFATDPRFRLAMDSHHDFFIRDGNCSIHRVDEQNATVYKNDLNGYLRTISCPPELHYLVMRLSGLTSMTQFSFDRTPFLILPNTSAYNEVLIRFKTSISSGV